MQEKKKIETNRKHVGWFARKKKKYKKKTSMVKEVLVAVDFECLHQNIWSTFAVVVLQVDVEKNCTNLLWCFSVGQKEEQVKFEMSKCDSWSSTKHFWKKHTLAYEHNRQTNMLSTKNKAEEEIVRNINYIRNKWTNFKMICDNPSMDIRILDNILLTHGSDPISIRPPNKTYLQVICSWSYRLSATAILNLSKQQLRSESQELANKIFRQMKCGEPAVAHTPVYDCVMILASYMYINICINNNKKKQQLVTTTTS